MFTFVFKLKRHVCLLFALVLLGCQSTATTNPVIVTSESLLYDQGFEGFSDHLVETEDEIFYLDEEAKTFVHKAIVNLDSEIDQVEALVHAVFDRSELNLLYQANANTVANDTYKLKEANCLSMSIMTYALTREAGFKVDFQEVLIPEYWTRRQGYSLLNGHINLKFTPHLDTNVLNLRTRSYQIDFDPQPARRSFSKKPVSKERIVAMFYNNKGADALVKQQFPLAYAYFRQAVINEPLFTSAWVNLGILYRMAGYLESAEKVYLHALQQSSNNLNALENLAYLYKINGNINSANKIIAKVERKRAINPYYHVNLGEQDIEQRNWKLALGHFKKALILNRNMHEGYFGLARVYFEIGELDESERYLKLAKNKAFNNHYEEKYQSKLDFLSSL
ncbi:MAG: tetratricopeptide repeat protein [Paraglaciecola sp.]|uniref:tetratricopeptide repeat protein n=1 Tax=Paraglaciecola sp. TaxID=1920173 RepID=UPI003267BAA5